MRSGKEVSREVETSSVVLKYCLRAIYILTRLYIHDSAQQKHTACGAGCDMGPSAASVGGAREAERGAQTTAAAVDWREVRRRAG